MKLSSLSILIPCFNDEKTIETAVDEAFAIGRRIVKKHIEVVVINDGSTDSSGQILEKMSEKYGPMMRYISHAQNVGYGATIRELYMTGQHDWLYTCPGDYQVGASEVETLLPYTRDFDLVVGWRKQRQDPPRRIVQSAFYNYLTRKLLGISVHDVNSVRLMKKSILKKIELNYISPFVDTELLVKATRAGFRVGEAVVQHRADPGVGGGGSISTIVSTFSEMIRFKNQIDKL